MTREHAAAGELAELKNALKTVNLALWRIEDAIRAKERGKDFRRRVHRTRPVGLPAQRRAGADQAAHQRGHGLADRRGKKLRGLLTHDLLASFRARLRRFSPASPPYFGKLGVEGLNSNLATLIRTVVIFFVTAAIVTLAAGMALAAGRKTAPRGLPAAVRRGDRNFVAVLLPRPANGAGLAGRAHRQAQRRLRHRPGACRPRRAAHAAPRGRRRTGASPASSSLHGRLADDAAPFSATAS